MEVLKTNPVKVIRAYCLECCLNSAHEVALCTAAGCPLHPFRMGKNPYRAKREMSADELERRRASMLAARSALKT